MFSFLNLIRRQKMKKVVTILTILVAAQLGLASQTWIGVSGGYYHDPTMWDDGAVPDQSSSQPCYLYNTNGHKKVRARLF